GDMLHVFETEIPYSVRAAETSMEGKSIFAHDRRGKVAAAYENLTREVLAHEWREATRPRTQDRIR
ncbi:MAG: ParA family protein, partial [Lachnospiraceae bacterium]|nr:ParA family protein [Lachnospiraceae bacterium]